MNDEHNKDKSTALTPEVTENFTKVIRAVSELTRSAHEIAREGPTISLLTFGPVLILLAVMLHVFPQIKLGLGEFSVLVASGTLLFIAGAAMRLYQFKVQTEIDREIRQQAFRTLNVHQAAAVSDAKTGGGEKVQL